MYLNIETTKSVKCDYFIVNKVSYLQDTVTRCIKKAIFSILSYFLGMVHGLRSKKTCSFAYKKKKKKKKKRGDYI